MKGVTVFSKKGYAGLAAVAVIGCAVAACLFALLLTGKDPPKTGPQFPTMTTAEFLKNMGPSDGDDPNCPINIRGTTINTWDSQAWLVGETDDQARVVIVCEPPIPEGPVG